MRWGFSPRDKLDVPGAEAHCILLRAMSGLKPGPISKQNRVRTSRQPTAKRLGTPNFYPPLLWFGIAFPCFSEPRNSASASNWSPVSLP